MKNVVFVWEFSFLERGLFIVFFSGSEGRTGLGEGRKWSRDWDKGRGRYSDFEVLMFGF